MSSTVKPRARYRAFISYSHRADLNLAPALQSALNRFARPWYRIHWVSVFRDESDLSASPNLWSTILAALTNSDHLVLLASPEAASSKWVQKEVGYWRGQRSTDRLLIALTSGSIEWDAEAADFDWALTTALPRNVAGAFKELPHYADLRDFQKGVLSASNPAFLSEVAKLAAPIHGRPLREIFGEEVRQRRRRTAATLALGLVLATAAGIATWNAIVANAARRQVERHLRVANARRLAAQSEAAAGSTPQRALLLAAEAVRATASFRETVEPAAEQALRRALANAGGAGVAQHGTKIQQLAFAEPSGEPARIVSVSADGEIQSTTLSPPHPTSARLRSPGPRVAALQVHAKGDAVSYVDHAGHVETLSLVVAGKTMCEANWPFEGDDQFPDVMAGEGEAFARSGTDGRLRYISWCGLVRRTDELLGVGPIEAIRFGPGIALAIGKHGVELLGLSPRQPRLSTLLVTSRPRAVAFAADGRLLVASSHSGTGVWSLDGPRLRIRRAALADVEAVAVSQGSTVALAQRDGGVWLWDFAGLDPPRRIAGVPFEMIEAQGSRLAFSPDARWLYAVDGLRASALLDLGAGPPAEARVHILHRHPEGGPIDGPSPVAFAFSPDSSKLFDTGDDANAYVYDLTTRQPAVAMATLRGHDSFVSTIVVSGSGRFLATGGFDGAVRVWDLEHFDVCGAPQVLRSQGRELPPPEDQSNPGSGIRRLLFSANEVSLAVEGGERFPFGLFALRPDRTWANVLDGHWAQFDAGLRWLVLGPEPLLYSLEHPLVPMRSPPLGPGEYVFDPGGSTVAVAGESGVSLWDLSAGRPALVERRVVGSPLVAVASRGPEYVALDEARRLHVFRPGELPGPVVDVSRAFDDPDDPPVLRFVGPRLVLGTHYFMDRWSATAVQTLPTQKWDNYRWLDSRWLVGDLEGVPRQLLDLGKAEGPRVLEIPSRGFCPDANCPLLIAFAVVEARDWLLASDDSGRIWVVSLRNWPRVERELILHDLRATVVSADPRGRAIVSGDAAGRVLLLRVSDSGVIGDPIELPGHPGEIQAVAFSPGGRFVATGGGDWSVRVHPLGIEALVDTALEVAGRPLTAAERNRYEP